MTIKETPQIVKAMEAKPWDACIGDTMLMWSADRERRTSMDAVLEKIAQPAPEPLVDAQTMAAVAQASPPLPEVLPPLITAPGEERAQRVLKVELRSSGNKDQDKRRLQRLLGFLHSCPGQDHFALLLVENGHRYMLDFPNDTTGICEELLRRLGEIVGAHNVSVEGG
ncbi:MAG: hypothetical protein HGA28_09145 [Anaerolineaceae bacterium]|nr:hypothetical protein [Anaerolineaceae bacterium]